MLYQILLSTRPRQWVKNLLVLAALVFSGHLFEWAYLAPSVAGLACFCVLSGSVYLINDLWDVERDRRHPRKALRPIASGSLGSRPAVAAAVILAAFGLTVAFGLHPRFGWVALTYVGLNLAYSYRLKHTVVLDVLSVATGFLLRALAGALVIDVEISAWFVLCSFALALFLAVVKRRQELLKIPTDPGRHRASLEHYSVAYLDQVISVLTSATLVCYALYAMGVGEGGAHAVGMRWTVPFVLYGVLRYLYLVYREGEGDNPTAVIWRDRPLQYTILLWALVSAVAMYGIP